MKPLQMLEKMSKVLFETSKQINKFCNVMSRAIEDHQQDLKKQMKEEEMKKNRDLLVDDIDIYFASFKSEESAKNEEVEEEEERVVEKRRTKRIQKEKKKTKIEEDPKKKSKRPVNRFMLYLKDNEKGIRKENPLAKSTEIPRIASSKWHSEKPQVREHYWNLYKKLWKLHMDSCNDQIDEEFRDESQVLPVRQSEEKRHTLKKGMQEE